MPLLNRWRRAQEYERGYWEALATKISSGAVSQLEWYRWRADQLALKLKALGLDTLESGRAAIIEVGSGPIGVVPFLKATERVAVDPLEPFYAGHAVLSNLRTNGVQYRAGVGEQLPSETARYDLAIIENCIDHVKNPQAVRAELSRVLKPGGVLYLTVNCRTPLGYVVHRILSRTRLDPGHPHTFTPPRARRFLEDGGFTLLSTAAQSYSEAWREDFQSSDPKARLKAILGVSEFLLTIIARRATAP